MLRSFFLLSVLTICGAFTPSMCQLEPKKPIPPALKQLKYDIPIPVKPKLKLSDLPRSKSKIIYVATFTRMGIVIRPKKIRIRLGQARRQRARTRPFAAAARGSRPVRVVACGGASRL